MSENTPHEEPPSKLYGHKIVDSVSGMHEGWDYTHEPASDIEEQFQMLDAFKEVEKTVVYRLDSSYDGDVDGIVEEHGIDQHDEVGSKLGMLAAKLVSEGYDPKTVADRLRKNAYLFETGELPEEAQADE